MPFNYPHPQRLWGSGGSKPWTGAELGGSSRCFFWGWPRPRREQCARCDFTNRQPFATTTKLSYPLPSAPQSIRISFTELEHLVPGKRLACHYCQRRFQSQNASKAFPAWRPSVLMLALQCLVMSPTQGVGTVKKGFLPSITDRLPVTLTHHSSSSI